MAFKFNPFTGNFDQVDGSAEIGKIAAEKAVQVIKSILTTDRNSLGNKNFFYDKTANAWVEAGPQIVTDCTGEIMFSDDGEDG